MNAFAKNVSHIMTQTENSALSNATTTNDMVDVFARIGSSRQVDISNDFLKAFMQNQEQAMRMLFWSRDIRQGAGERETFRKIMLRLEETHSRLLTKVLHLVPEYGRWDDLLIFKGPYLKAKSYALIQEALEQKNGLCAKWMPRKGDLAVELTKYLQLKPRQYRKLLVSLSNTVEQQMCAKDWDNINYSHVPSVASARYQKAFGKHSPEKYSAYLSALEKGEKIDGKAVKINAGTLFPHDIIRSFNNGNPAIAEQQWKALPNYAGSKNVLPMVDVSGSMTSPVSGSVSAMDVAVGLGLYISEKQDSAFKNIVLTFTDKPKLFQLTGSSTYANYEQITRMEWGMNTNIERAFEAVLAFAATNKVPQADMPEYLMIISDMEFDACAGGTTNYQNLKSLYKNAGYELPKVVFWNVAARNAQYPVTTKDANTCLISGYSPSIMKAVLDGQMDTFSPENIMLETIMDARYDVVSAALNS